MNAAPFELRRVEHVMGTTVSMLARGPAEQAQALCSALDDAVAWLHEVDDRFTTYRPGSEWLRYCRHEVSLSAAHPDLCHVVERTAELERETRGAFSLTADPNRPPEPAAYVKGCAVQRAADLLASGGADAVCVNGGGDVAAWRAEGCWRVGVQDPFRPDRVVAIVELGQGAVATSGTYERGNHIIEPSSGIPAGALASATIVGPDLGTADAYSTAAFVLGRRAAEWVATLEGYGAFLVHNDGSTETVGLRLPAEGHLSPAPAGG